MLLTASQCAWGIGMLLDMPSYLCKPEPSLPIVLAKAGHLDIEDVLVMHYNSC